MSSGNFFDFQASVTRRGPAPVPTPAGEAPLTVTQLTARIAKAIKAGQTQGVLVKGEVSNYRPNNSSGHLYFTLKDQNACIDCVMFESDAVRVKFTPDNGMELIAGGRIDVYAAKGKYQLYVSSLQPVGQGALELAFRQLKAKLEAAGFFAPERKRPLPAYPMRVAIVTGANTAALQDVLKVFSRFPWMQLSLYPVPVQGEGAAERIVDAIQTLGRYAAAADAPDDGLMSFDVLLLIRGGGSLEDLWCFNDERVARAIAASVLPVITGIGHEIDTSIADLVADYWAHTPTEAAQVLTRNWQSAPEIVDSTQTRLRRNIRAAASQARQRLTGIERHELFRRPLDRINALRQLMDDRRRALSGAIRQQTARLREQLHDAAARLEKQAPANILARLHVRLSDAEQRLLRSRIQWARQTRDQLAALEARLIARHPRHSIRLAAQQLQGSEKRLHRAMRHALHEQVVHLDSLATHLRALSPEEVLRRGYSITRRKRDGAIVRNAQDIKPGDRLLTRLAEGEIESAAIDAKQPGLFE